MDVDTIEAGPKLDALVAERVMGWHVTDKRPPSPQNWAAYPDVWFETPSGDLMNAAQVPYYSTDIPAAWQVFEKIARPDDLSIGVRSKTFYYNNPRKWETVDGYAVLEHDTHNNELRETEIAWARTAPLAICRAALKAATRRPAVARTL